MTSETPSAPSESTPGYTFRVREMVARAVARTSTLEFGFDVLDTIGYGLEAFGVDVVDVLNRRERGIPSPCTVCRRAWLMGPEALTTGKCWSCRYGGAA
jgi:hypothetical protein